jgi:hypothetical protein
MHGRIRVTRDKFYIFVKKRLSVKVFLNGKEIIIFKGATLGDIVLASSKQSFKMLKSGYLGIYDRYGFMTESDGPAVEGQHFFLKIIRKQK